MKREEEAEEPVAEVQGERGRLVYVGADGSQQELPAGMTVTEDGQIASASALVKLEVLKRLPWEKANDLLDKYIEGGKTNVRAAIMSKYGVAALAVVAVALLGWADKIGGQALSGFMGAVIGYLLGRKKGE